MAAMAETVTTKAPTPAATLAAAFPGPDVGVVSRELLVPFFERYGWRIVALPSPEPDDALSAEPSDFSFLDLAALAWGAWLVVSLVGDVVVVGAWVAGAVVAPGTPVVLVVPLPVGGAVVVVVVVVDTIKMPAPGRCALPVGGCVVA